jgi:hypothetical protein
MCIRAYDDTNDLRIPQLRIPLIDPQASNGQPACRAMPAPEKHCGLIRCNLRLRRFLVIILEHHGKAN